MGSAELMLFGGLVMAGASVYLFMSSLLAGKPGESQLSWASGTEPIKSKNAVINLCRPMVHQFTLSYAGRVKSEKYRKKIRTLIKTGGLASELNEDEFIGLQIFLGFAFPVFLYVMNFSLDLGLGLPLVICLGAIGFFMPQMHCRAMKKSRELSVQKDMPFFIDLLALSVEAGLDFFGAIQKIVDKVADKESVLAAELQIVLKDIKIGSSKAEALKEMAARLDMSEITSFVAVLIDAEASGSSISQVLKDQSVQMRLERFIRAEKAGARASQLILLPLMLFILPAVFIMVFGPVILQMGKG
ncbi:MAG: type II secretion system F family protein [Bdellovibrionaceae bacterium]|nr:type II secretion system F family protein [Pseudobdellovibrionaceae bacterium]